jgi:hypothetical protein
MLKAYLFKAGGWQAEYRIRKLVAHNRRFLAPKMMIFFRANWQITKTLFSSGGHGSV